MPIFFKPSASDFSLSADSIGNRWLQEPFAAFRLDPVI